MKVAVVHNLAEGGARRRMLEQTRRLAADVVEVCLGTATPVTGDARVFSGNITLDDATHTSSEPRRPRAPGARRCATGTTWPS